MTEATIIPPDNDDSDTTGQNTEGGNGQEWVIAAAAFAPVADQIIKRFFEGKAAFAKEIEGSKRINANMIFKVVALVCATAMGSLFMLLYFLGPDEGAKFFTQITTLIGGLLGGLGIGLSIKSRK